MKNLVLILFASLFILSFASASLGGVTQGEPMNIRILANCSSVNLTEVTNSQTSETFIINQPMQNLGGQTFNYTFYNTSTVGTYSFSWNNPCIDCSQGNCGNSFSVTPNGDQFTTGQSIVYIILIITNLVFLSLFIFLAIKTPFDNEKSETKDGTFITRVTKTKYVKLFSIWISYGLYFWFITIISGLVRNYITFAPLQEMTSNLWIFSQLVGYGLSIFMVWFIFYNIWKDIVLNKIILREGTAFINRL